METTPIHHREPALYGITTRDAITLRLRYLSPRLASAKEIHSQLLSLKILAPQSQRWLPEMYQDMWLVTIEKLEKNIHYLKKIQPPAPTLDNPNPQPLHQPNISIEEIKENVKIPHILTLYNIPYSHHRFFKLRNEKTPSCQFNTEGTLYNDFGSGEGGSVIDLYMKINRVTAGEAIKELIKLI